MYVINITELRIPKKQKMGSFRFLEHTADIAVEVSGSSLEELFLNAALAWKESVIDEFNAGAAAESRQIQLSEGTAEELLVSFLSEFNFLLSARKWILYSVDRLRISVRGKNELNLETRVTGEQLRDSKHMLKEEIKAVTFHQMKIEKRDNEYITTIVFDI